MFTFYVFLKLIRFQFLCKSFRFSVREGPDHQHERAVLRDWPHTGGTTGEDGRQARDQVLLVQPATQLLVGTRPSSCCNLHLQNSSFISSCVFQVPARTASVHPSSLPDRLSAVRVAPKLQSGELRVVRSRAFRCKCVASSVRCC